MKHNRFIVLLILLFIFNLLIFVLPLKTSAGGGPQLICKNLTQKQGWLIDNTNFDEELSENACISRNPSAQEKDEILEICKSEPKGEFRDDCLDKCRKYYSDITFRECKSNEVTSIKTTLYTSNIKNMLKTQMSLQETIVVSFAVVIFFYIVVLLVKKLGKHLKPKNNN